MAQICFIFSVFNQRPVEIHVTTDASGSRHASTINSMQKDVVMMSELNIWAMYYQTNESITSSPGFFSR
jgi:hypothetical protein